MSYCLSLLIFLGFSSARSFAHKSDAWPQCGGVAQPVNIGGGGYVGLAFSIIYVAEQSFVLRIPEYQQRLLYKVYVDPR